MQYILLQNRCDHVLSGTLKNLPIGRTWPKFGPIFCAQRPPFWGNKSGFSGQNRTVTKIILKSHFWLAQSPCQNKNKKNRTIDHRQKISAQTHPKFGPDFFLSALLQNAPNTQD